MIALLAAALLLQDPDPGESAVDVSYLDGLRFRTRDGSFDGYLGGFVRVHGRSIFDRPDDEVAPLRTIPDGLWIRQVRIDTGGTFQRDWAYRFSFDVASGVPNQSTGAGPSSTTGTVRDAWVEWKRYREFVIRAGQYFVPFSMEEMDPGRFHEFAERAPSNRLAPGREAGVEVYGSLFEERLRYFVMLSQGGSLINDQGRSTADSNDEKELAGTVWVRPLPGLRFSAGGMITDVDDADGARFDLITTELSVLYLDSTAGLLDGRRLRAETGILLAAGPMSLRAEFLWRRDELADGSPEDDVEARGGYALATWLVTGETKRVDARTVPTRDGGAIELAFRAGRVEIDRAFSSGLAPRPGNADDVTSLSAAATWWLGRQFRLTLNAVHERYGDRLDFGAREKSSLTGVLMRFQFEF